MSAFGIGTWLAVIDRFSAHWNAMDAAVGAPGFRLTGPYGSAQLAADRAAVVAALNADVGFENVVESARAERDICAKR